METLFTHAVVALDQSDASDIIVNTLPHLKKLGLKKVTLLTVVSVPYTEEEEIDTSKEEKQLNDYKKLLESKELAVYTEIKAGTHAFAPAEILKTADEQTADFIIIGNRGKSMIEQLLLGSTASEVLQRSHMPVFLVSMKMEWIDEEKNERRLYVTQSSENVLDHVMHATDFSETAGRAFEVVRDLDSKGKIGKISLIHVQGHHAIALKDPVSHDELMQKNEENLEEIRNTLSGHTREDAEIIITFGTPGKEIIQAIEERGVTLAVMGSQGKGFVHDFFLGGVSSQVTRFSKIPVLLIPAERE